MTTLENTIPHSTETPPTSLRVALAGVAALLISAAVLLMGNGLQGTLVPVRGNIENFNSLQLGLLGTGYYIGITLGKGNIGKQKEA